MSKPIGLFDMDGTLFDYDGAMERDMRKLMAPEEPEPTDWYDDSKPHFKARMDLIKMQPGWWRKLAPLELGFALFDVAGNLGFKCKILTKGPAKKSKAWSEKVECIANHFDPFVPIDIVGEDKSGTYGRFLCDDYPPFLLGWLEHRPRGLGILISNKRNKGFKHSNVIRCSHSDDFPKITDALIAVRDRQPGEHWREKCQTTF